MSWWSRLRTSRGFGVHSPFAFSLITDTLRMPDDYSYYAFDSLTDPTARLIYSVAAHLDTGHIIDRTGLVSQSAFRGRGTSKLYVIASDDTLPDTAICDNDAVMLIAPDLHGREALRRELDASGHGMSFHAFRNPLQIAPSPLPYALGCFLSHLPRQDFELYV
ncbi:MAG: hypothetical protein ACI31E_08625 [Muribaculaceae bacterium]